MRLIASVLSTVLLLLAAPAAAAVCQAGVDHPYGDLPNMPFALPVPDPALCLAACNNEPRCQIFAFCYSTNSSVCNSNYRTPYCYLKGTVEPRSSNPCVCTGARTAPAPPPPPPPPPSGAAAYMLHNGSATATLGYYGLVSLTVQNTSMNISADGFAIDLNATTYTVAKLPTPQVQQLDSASLMYSYALPQAGQSLRVTYSLSPTFIAKRITLLTGGLPVLFGNITPWYQLELTSSANLQTTIRATGVLGGDEAGFLRFADQAGVFLLAQNPLLELQWMQPAALNINRFSVGYWAGLAYDPQIYGEQTFDADDGIMGLYRLAGRPVPTPARNLVTKLSYWGNSAVGDSPVLDTAERDAVTTAAAAYYIAPPTTQTVKKHVGWCENDYQIDLANATSAAEYHRVMQTLNAIGATTVTFAPSDSSVSTRKNCTDSWCWEEVLWFSLGELLRQNRWMPDRDPVPASISTPLGWAKSYGLDLHAYIYPILAFQQNLDWLTPDGSQAFLGNPLLQQFLLTTFDKFLKVMGTNGLTFDYTFIQDGPFSTYAQWWGWRRILATLRKTYPGFTIDNRQQNHEWGMWMWTAGSYAEPLMSDENSESWSSSIQIADIHTDRVAGNHLRDVNYAFKQGSFCPPAAVPGFFSHQTERSDYTGRAYYTDYDIRDFDFMGYKYSLLSSIGTAGLNTVINMVPGRDMEEFQAFPDSEKLYMRSWLSWTDSAIPYLLNTKFFPIIQGQGLAEGTFSTVDGSSSYVFLYNPYAEAKTFNLTLDGSMDLVPLADGEAFAVEEIDFTSEGFGVGANRTIAVEGYGATVSLNLRGRSALVFFVHPQSMPPAQPLLLGINGGVQLTSSKTGIVITEAVGPRGSLVTTLVILPANVAAADITSVTVNGISASKLQAVGTSALTFQIKFGASQDTAFSVSQGIVTHCTNNVCNGTVLVPSWVMQQLAARNRSFPVAWQEAEKYVPWLAPGRLLLFVDCDRALRPADNLSLSWDGRPVPLWRSYNDRKFTDPQAGAVDDASFMGFFADVTSFVNADHPQIVQLSLPSHISSEQYRGMYFDNVVADWTTTTVTL